MDVDDRAFMRIWNQMSPKSAKKVICMCPLGSFPFFFLFSSLRRVDLSALFLPLRECNTLSALSLLTQSIDILCMYYIILLLMTDKYTELFILLHFIYIKISILKCLQ